MSTGRVRLVVSTKSGPREIVVVRDRRGFTIEDSGEAGAVDFERLPDGRISLVFEDGRQVCGRVVSADGTVAVETARGAARVEIDDPSRRRRSHGAEEDAGSEAEEIRALMPGRVVEVAVEEGGAVEAGALVLVLEAMKMQNEIRAGKGGAVLLVAVAPGDAVEGGALLARIGPRREPASG